MKKESTLSALHPHEAQIRSIQAAAPVSRSEHRFYVTMALAILITVFWGFAPSYYFKPFAPVETHPLPILIHAHAIVFSAWILLLLCQTTLVTAGPVRDLLLTRRLHPTSFWGGIVILASFPIRGAVAMSSTWHIFAYWLTH